MIAQIRPAPIFGTIVPGCPCITLQYQPISQQVQDDRTTKNSAFYAHFVFCTASALAPITENPRCKFAPAPSQTQSFAQFVHSPKVGMWPCRTTRLNQPDGGIGLKSRRTVAEGRRAVCRGPAWLPAKAEKPKASSLSLGMNGRDRARTCDLGYVTAAL
jgi:hypothetical protein